MADVFRRDAMRCLRPHEWSPYWVYSLPQRTFVPMQRFAFETEDLDLPLLANSEHRAWFVDFVRSLVSEATTIHALNPHIIRRMNVSTLGKCLPFCLPALTRIKRRLELQPDLAYVRDIRAGSRQNEVVITIRIVNAVLNIHSALLGLPPLDAGSVSPVPPRADVVAFWTSVEGKMLETLNAKLRTNRALGRLSHALMPHQIRNMIRITCKEWLGMSPLQALKHYRLQTSGPSSPLHPIFGFLDDSVQALLLGGDLGSSIATRTATIIQDSVGSGKTRSALSVVCLNGPRHEDPFGCSASFLESVPDLARGVYPWTRVINRPDSLRAFGLGSYRHRMSQIAVQTSFAQPGSSPQRPHMPRAATLIIIQHNMIKHWLDEIKALRPFVVGVVGSKELARGKAITPRAMAENYDVVLMPNTLLRVSDLDAQDTVELADCGDRLWHDSQTIRDDGTIYVFHGELVGDAAHRVTAIASSAYMHTKFNTQTKTLESISQDELMPPHLMVFSRLLSIHELYALFEVRGTTDPSAPALSCWARSPSGATFFSIKLTSVVSLRRAAASTNPLANPSSPYVSDRQLYWVAADGGAADVECAPVAALARVRWSRMIVDELHLYHCRSTQKRRCIDAIRCDSFVGLTAQKDMAFTHNTGMFLSVLPRDYLWGTNVSCQPLSDCMYSTNSICNSVTIATRPLVRDAIMVTLPAAARDLVRALCLRVRSSYRERGYEILRPQQMGIVGSQAAMAIRHVLRQVSFDDEPFSLDAYALPIVHNISERRETDRAAAAPGSSAAGAALSLHLIKKFIDDPGAQAVLEVAELRGEEVSCPICFDDADAEEVRGHPRSWVAFQPCHHTMCTSCFTEAVDSRNTRISQTCVMCRTRITALNYVGGGAAAAASQGGAAAAAGQGGAAASASQGGAAAASPILSSKVDHLMSLLLYLTMLRADDGDTLPEQAANGIVIFCECSDRQLVLMKARISEGLASVFGEEGVLVHAILSSNTTNQRTRILEEITSAKKIKILLVRYRMCAVGLNFIFANHCILFNLPHRSDYLHQSVGRLCRIGQRAPVVEIWPLVYGDSIESRMWATWKDVIHDRRARVEVAELAAGMISD